LLKALPLSAIRSIWKLGAYKYLQEITADKDFWRAYFRQLIASISKQECVGRLQIWIEFDRNSHFTERDLASWTGKVLILEAETDAVFPQSERAALRKLYPQARAITFKDGGHAAAISNRGEYIEAMVGFLEGQSR
jgi:pimeloyl-ACP methyl ester carboxylesterase